MPSIIYTDYYLPEKLLSVEEIIENSSDLVMPENETIDSFCSKFREQSGLDKITIGNASESMQVFTDLLTNFFEKTAIPPEEIAYIMFTDPDNLFYSKNVNIASCLKEEFKLSKAAIFYIRQGCAGTLISMGMLNKLLNKDNKYGIILSSSFAPSIEKRFLTYSIWGDAQGIAVIGYEGDSNEIVDWISLSDGSASYNNYKNIKAKWTSSDRLAIIQQGSGVIKQLLARNNIAPSDLEIMICQITHYVTYSSVYPGLIGLPRNKVFLDNLPNGGHTGDVDLIRNIHDSFNKFNFEKESYILLYSKGIENVDVCYQAVLLKIK